MESRLLLSGTTDLPTIKVTFVNSSGLLDVGIIRGNDQANWSTDHFGGGDSDAGYVLSGNANPHATYSQVGPMVSPTAASYTSGSGGWIFLNPQPSLVSQPTELMPVAGPAYQPVGAQPEPTPPIARASAALDHAQLSPLRGQSQAFEVASHESSRDFSAGRISPAGQNNDSAPSMTLASYGNGESNVSRVSVTVREYGGAHELVSSTVTVSGEQSSLAAAHAQMADEALEQWLISTDHNHNTATATTLPPNKPSVNSERPSIETAQSRTSAASLAAFGRFDDLVAPAESTVANVRSTETEQADSLRWDDQLLACLDEVHNVSTQDVAHAAGVGLVVMLWRIGQHTASAEKAAEFTRPRRLGALLTGKPSR